MPTMHRVARVRESLAELWSKGDICWARASVLELTHFRPEGSAHRPRTVLQTMHDGENLALRFELKDRWVVARSRKLNDPVCRDSCVEAFLRPRPDRGYVNLELNCRGVLHASFIEDWQRSENGFARFTPFDETAEALLERSHSLEAGVQELEIEDDLEYDVGMLVRRELLERFFGPLGCFDGQRWTANFYKCADASSHPHWISWSPLVQRNFHSPECFGILDFDRL